MTAALREHAIKENIRVKQQGRGRPIISSAINDYTVVAIGDTLQYSKNWKTFADFLFDYIKMCLGGDWGNEQIAKPFAERHPILQWYDGLCCFQAANRHSDGEISSGPMTGVVYCYLGLAYSLFLLKHNVELQNRFVARLKDVKQFPGAYYELIVANCLIRSGFRLELENEVDQATKHCEFSARSETTGTRYWVEAKMRSVPGILQKTDKDGSNSNDPTSRLTAHLSAALKKPAPGQRMIFIDINSEPSKVGETPNWLDKAVRRLRDSERDLKKGNEAYVFVTNMAFHRALDSTMIGTVIFPYGLGISDFAKLGKIRLADRYRRKQKHIDAHNVMEALASYPQIPDTFDGRPASEVFSNGQNPRIEIGKTYFFENDEGGGEIGTVTSVAIDEEDRRAWVAITTKDGESWVLQAKLSDAEIEDYRKYGNAYFGEPNNRKGKCKDEFELYEWFVDCYSKTPKEKLLEFAKDAPDIEQLKGLDRFSLVLEICERWAYAAASPDKRN